MATVKEIAASCRGELTAFNQLNYVQEQNTKTRYYMNVAIAERVELNKGVCAGLTAAFLIVHKCYRDKAAATDTKSVFDDFVDYLNTPDGRMTVATIQVDEEKGASEADREAAMTRFFAEGMGFKSLKLDERTTGGELRDHDVATFVRAKPGYYTLSVSTAEGKGHLIGMYFGNDGGGKTGLAFFDPNCGLTVFRGASAPVDFLGFFGKWLTTRFGNIFGGNKFGIARWV